MVNPSLPCLLMMLILRVFKFRIYNFLLVLLLPTSLLLPIPLFAATAESSLYKYTINLESAEKKITTSINLKNTRVNGRYKIYQTRVKLGRKKLFYRLRLGFFKSRKEAKRVAKELRTEYPALWVDNINKQDRKILRRWLKSKNSFQTNNFFKSKKAITKKRDKNKISKTKALMLSANKAMANKKYRRAAGIYTRIIKLRTSRQHQQAMEFLGLAYEKNGQLRHARAKYRLYLKKFTKGENANRVRQRLLSLETVLLKPKNKLKGRKLKPSDWQFSGNLLQFYRQDVVSSEQYKISNINLSTNANINLRKRTDSLKVYSQINVSHMSYLNNPDRKDDERIKRFFVDLSDLNNNKSIRLGRQSQNKGGVSGIMDGVWLGYRLHPQWKFNLVAGLPVQTTVSNTAQSNRPFWGVSLDIGTIKKYWNFNVYTINQKVDSIVDRNAMGAEIRYRKNKQNHFALVDYDTYFTELNRLFYVGNWQFNNKAAVTLTVDRRKSPVLTTTNAVVGQNTSSIEELLSTYTEAELKQIAKDRTHKYNSTALSTTIPISKKWKLLADATVSGFSATPASAGVNANEGTGNEFYFGIQLIGHDVFSANETIRYQIRQANTRASNRTKFTVSSRFNFFNKKLRFRPKVDFENIDYSNGGTMIKLKPSLKLDYKIHRRFKLELYTGYEYAKATSPAESIQNTYSLSAGVIWDF